MEKQDYVKSFSRSLRTTEPGWLTQMRRLAMERFDRLDFPTTSDEEWKYTNIAPIKRIPFDLGVDSAAAVDPGPFCFEGDGSLLVFVDGYLSKKASRIAALPDGSFLGSITDTIEHPSPAASRIEEHLARHAHYDTNAFAALNTAFYRDGAFLLIPKNSIVSHPIHILHISTGATRTTHPRNLIVVGDHAHATIVESYASLAPADAPTFANVVTEIVIGKEAHVDHYKVQQSEENAYHIATTQISLDRASDFRTHSIVMASKFSRNTTGAVLNDEGIECTLNGLYVVTGDQHVDSHTAIDHAKPHCNSHELYKGILDGRSRAVFNGKVFVRKDAQKTDAKQTNRNLILSDEAVVDTKPQLEIFADDVKCTHGATIGQLDDDALFYLQSRGVGAETARSLLTYGFATDILKRIKIEPLRAQLDALLHERLRNRFGVAIELP